MSVSYVAPLIRFPSGGNGAPERNASPISILPTSASTLTWVFFRLPELESLSFLRRDLVPDMESFASFSASRPAAVNCTVIEYANARK